MKKILFWILLILVSISSFLWLGDILIESNREYSEFRGAARLRQAFAKNGTDVGLAAAGDWSAKPSLLNGIRLAAEKINKEGGLLGRRLRLDAVDDHGSLEGAFQAAQHICDRIDNLFVIGHSSASLSQAVVQNYEFYGILMISPLSANLTQSQKNFRLIFSNRASIGKVSEKLLDLVLEKGWTRLGIMYDGSDPDPDLAQGFETILNSRDIKTPLMFGYNPGYGEDYLKNLIKDWQRDYQLQALILTTASGDSLEIIRSFKDEGVDVPVILGQYPGDGFLEEEKSRVDIYLPLQVNTQSAGYRQFESDYFGRYGESPEVDAAFGYDSVMLLAEAIKTANSLDASLVADTMETYSPGSSITGTQGFDPDGNARKDHFRFIRIGDSKI